MARVSFFHSSKLITDFSAGWKQTSWIISVEAETLSRDHNFFFFLESDFIAVPSSTPLPLLQKQYNSVYQTVATLKHQRF